MKCQAVPGKAYRRSALESISPGSIRPTSTPNAVDPPKVLGRYAPIKLHQIWTEVGINDDTP